MRDNITTNRETWLTLILITVVFLFVYQFIFDSKIDLNGDNASYYILGKAINGGEGYVNINSIYKTPNNHFLDHEVHCKQVDNMDYIDFSPD